MSLLPILEIRGSLPFAIFAGGIPWYYAYFYAVFFNILAAPLAYLVLDTIHHKLYGIWPFYAGIFDRSIERTRQKIEPRVNKWGILGVALFVGIPLPITGAWTGTLGAWLMGLDRKKTVLAVTLGVSMAGIIILAVIFLGWGVLHFFIKEPAGIPISG